MGKRSGNIIISFISLITVFFCFASAAPVSAAAVTGATTNDTFASKQWYLESIHAREGWNAATGSKDVIVAVIDSGVDIEHPDIKANIWSNPSEIAGNHKDDDGDGYVDDMHGWNFIKTSNDVKPIHQADGLHEAWLHGTAVASLIAAVGNNDIGISGVAWNAKIMPLVALGSDGYGQDQDIVDAIHYAVAHGADVINLSFVGADFDTGLDQAIGEATSQGVLVVSAAGNSESTKGDNMDLTPGYPACDKGAAGRGSLTVSALTRGGQRAPYANYGACVDVSAPGEDLFAARPSYDPQTKQPAAGYIDDLTGTSVAAPLVSGLAVLLKSKHPSWTADELAQRIIETSDPLKDLPAEMRGKLGRGQINVARALQDDDAARRLGPVFLEASAAGQSPEIRILSEDGHELNRFYVGDTGDLRGVRASFIRWTGNRNPEIAVSMIGDQGGAWRIYRTDGVLVAAGDLGGNIRGGLYLASQDLDYSGHDTLFLGEADGNRAWLVSAGAPTPVEFVPFAFTGTRGVSGLSIMRPVAAFLVAQRFGDGQTAIVGSGGSTLAAGKIGLKSGVQGWLTRRAQDKQGRQAYDIVSTDGRLVFVNDAVGLKIAKDPVQISRWTQIPDGEIRSGGWKYFEAWPR